MPCSITPSSIAARSAAPLPRFLFRGIVTPADDELALYDKTIRLSRISNFTLRALLFLTAIRTMVSSNPVVAADILPLQKSRCWQRLCLRLALRSDLIHFTLPPLEMHDLPLKL